MTCLIMKLWFWHIIPQKSIHANATREPWMTVPLFVLNNATDLSSALSLANSVYGSWLQISCNLFQLLEGNASNKPLELRIYQTESQFYTPLPHTNHCRIAFTICYLKLVAECSGC